MQEKVIREIGLALNLMKGPSVEQSPPGDAVDTLAQKKLVEGHLEMERRAGEEPPRGELLLPPYRGVE